MTQDIRQRIEAERRIAMAKVLGSLRQSLDESSRHVCEAAKELSRRHLIAPAGAERIRGLVADLDHIPKILDQEERRHFGPEQ